MLTSGTEEMPAIRFRNVSKRFLLNRHQDRSVTDLLLRLVGRSRKKEYFWPLKDVSFDIATGTTVGIIGENGSGKSTALKLMAGILEPTTGEIELNGRVSALLELGAGFHHDLTGRENIYLAASMVNIPRKFVDEHLDEIIEFADIGPYIDMPVKHYSSGMYVRLGFAVAVHVDPQILLVDEVLAVGDETFQHKCLERIKHMQNRGVTIVLVSHNMGQVADMCSHAIWLHEGQVHSIGPVDQVIADYMAEAAALEQRQRITDLSEFLPEIVEVDAQRYERGAPSPDARRWGDGRILIQDVRLLDTDGRTAVTFTPDEAMRVEFDYVVQRSIAEPPAFGIAIYRLDGLWCYGTNTQIDGIELFAEEPAQSGTVVVELPAVQLLQGDYTLDVAIHNADCSITHDYIRDSIHFNVRNSKSDQGVFRPQVCWSLISNQEKVMR